MWWDQAEKRGDDMSSIRRFRKRSLWTLAIGVGSLLLCLRLLFRQFLPPQTVWKSPVREGLPCSRLPGANETLVIMKTGSTELQDKLPVHFHTTFQCYPHYVIFSDHDEIFEGHHILDALETVDEEIQDHNLDFELWRRLKQEGRAALAPEELSGPESKVSPVTGKSTNPGWKLDKWKFLPMVNQTFHLYPDMKWYIFVETDTYLFWSTALAWLNTLDHTKSYYMGSQMQIGEVIFAHGGSGFVVSHEGMRRVVDHYHEDKENIERFTNYHWAGDCVLGKAFREANAPLLWAWPVIQGVKPGALSYDKYDYGKRLWCYPTMSYHHMSPLEVEDIWRFEQAWLVDGTRLIRHRDVFKYYIFPRIAATRGTKTGWDNLSGKLEDAKPADSFAECRSRCMATAGCVQFAFSDGNCATSETPHWGEASPEVQSGWLVDRVEQFMTSMKPCEDELWVD